MVHDNYGGARAQSSGTVLGVSQYNANYYANVTAFERSGGGDLVVSFDVNGDGSLGNLLDPLGSELSFGTPTGTVSLLPYEHNYSLHLSPGGSAGGAASGDTSSRVVGTLVYYAVGQTLSGPFTWTYGSSAYNSVTLPWPSVVS